MINKKIVDAIILHKGRCEKVTFIKCNKCICNILCSKYTRPLTNTIIIDWCNLIKNNNYSIPEELLFDLIL